MIAASMNEEGLAPRSSTPTPTPVPAPRYETIASIGRGGMAEVFLAVTVGAGGVPKLAVLKRICPELTSEPQFVSMFLDEARLSVRMAHPNLVQTYEIIEEDAGLAIAMEYLDGQPLGRVLNRLNRPGLLSLNQRVRIVNKLLAGLDYAHELKDYDGTPLSVVHRDVSPNNVFITYDGSVKLVDFGVAKSVAAAHKTRPGTLKGKFSYMAPEQFLDQAADRRSDIFAVGVILWEMLAGRRFWNGVADNQIVAHLTSGQPLPALPGELGLPVELEEICARALSRDRGERYASAAEMEADLERVLTSTHEASDRLLGKAVAEGFAAERSERQGVIDRHLRQIRNRSYPLRSGSYPQLGAYPTPSVSLSPVVIPAVAAPARRPWVAVALGIALSGVLLAVAVSSRGKPSSGAGPMIESPPRAAGVRQPGPSAPPLAAPGAGAGVPRIFVIDPRDARATGLAAAGEAGRGRPSQAEPARRYRRSTASARRADARTSSSLLSTVGADLGADERRVFPPPRPINMASPFRQRTLAQPRPIDPESPFGPEAAPRTIDTANPFLLQGPR